MHHKELEMLDKPIVTSGNLKSIPKGTGNKEWHPVTKPQHYNKHGIECITAIKASMSDIEFQGYLKGNVEKYVWRFRYKNGLEDLKKAQWYINKLILELEHEQE